MSTLITILHVTVSLFLMLTVLLQSGKGGGMGALGGGNAATVFGGSGASSFLRKLTATAAVLFMVTSMVLAFISSTDTSDALEDLRDLARGIYPPLLADKGLLSALEAQARKASLPVEVHALGVDRYPQEIEAAAYFSCLEALQNVAKYAEASRAVVTLSDGGRRLRFEVADDGLGFDPSEVGYGTGLQGIADRLGALAGSLTVTSSVGNGTIVAGTIPVPDRR